LNWQRGIEAQPGAQGVDGLFRCVVAQRRLGRVARQNADKQENGGYHAQQDRHRQGETLRDVAKHDRISY
jgi:hypothetical protein